MPVLDSLRFSPRRLARDTAARLGDPTLHEVLWWTVPAVLLGLVLRLVLLFQWPDAFFQDDTRFVLKQAAEIADHGRIELEGRRPFLQPILFSLPLLAGQPLLPWVAWGQHALGLASIVLVGALCAAWFTFWRWWILPLTCIAALNPTLLWYEHCALPEYLYAFFSLAALLTGTWFCREPRPATFALLWLALLLAAGSRPESKLMAGFGILCAVVAGFPRPRALALWTVAALVGTWVIFKCTPTPQGGNSLLTTLLPVVPDQLSTAPGFPTYLEPLTREARATWALYPSDFNTTRKSVDHAAFRYLREQRSLSEDEADDRVDRLCRKAGLETALRRFDAIPRIVWLKFLESHDDGKMRDDHRGIPAAPFDPVWFHDAHLDVLFERNGTPNRTMDFAPHLFGPNDVPRSRDEARALLHKRYAALNPDWLTPLQRIVTGSLYHPEVLPPIEAGRQRVPGLGWIYPAAALGFLAFAFTRTSPVNVATAWAITLAFLLFMMFLTASPRSRYRTMFDPHLYFALFALIDTAAAAALGRLPSSKPGSSPTSLPSPHHG